MENFTVKSRAKDYAVFFEKDLAFLDAVKQRNGVWIIDRNVFVLYTMHFDDLPPESVILFDAREDTKTLAGAEDIYRQLLARQMKRHMTIVSVGGGITQDVSGFVASTFYRGMRWTYIPTTLLAQGDSCIGSKTSLNFDSSKNLIGTFYAPDEVFISAQFLDSLSPKDRYSGFGEIVKLQLMKARGEGDLPAIADRLARGSHPDAILELISDSLYVKKMYIEEDEFDTGRRRLLNYGHTLGHALESTSGFAIPHGLAVVLGMIFANIIALHRGRISSRVFDAAVHAALLPHLHADLLDLREEYLDAGALFENMKKDKKRVGDGVAFVLPGKDVELEVVQDVRLEEIQRGCRELKNVLLS